MATGAGVDAGRKQRALRSMLCVRKDELERKLRLAMEAESDAPGSLAQGIAGLVRAEVASIERVLASRMR